MRKLVIGYIFAGPSLGADEKIFIKLSKKNNFELVLLDIYADFKEEELKEKIKKCDIIFNNSAEEFAIEFEKTIEEFGKRVIDKSKSFYYIEDKWIFYLKCKEHKIPVPETILVSEQINVAKKELKKFNHWPVILKRVEGTMGEFVEMGHDLKEAIDKIKKFWKKGSQRLPIIAQEYIHSPSYRVTIIGGKIVQTAVKNNKAWKCTGVYAKKIKRFKVDKELKKIINKINKYMDIKVCGIDFLNNNGKWIVLEINSAPAFDFFEYEREKLLKEVVKFLKREVSGNK